MFNKTSEVSNSMNLILDEAETEARNFNLLAQDNQVLSGGARS